MALRTRADLLRGVVHDPTAQTDGRRRPVTPGCSAQPRIWRRFCRMLLGGGTYRGVRILSPLAVARMTSRATPADERNVRGLGWDIDSSFSSNRGELFTCGILRSHRIHGHVAVARSRHGHVRGVSLQSGASRRERVMSRRFARASQPSRRPLSLGVAVDAAESLVRPARTSGLQASAGFRPAVQPTLTGIDVLRADGFAPLKGKTRRSGDESYGPCPGRRDHHRF